MNASPSFPLAKTFQSLGQRVAFTLIELLVVIASWRSDAYEIPNWRYTRRRNTNPKHNDEEAGIDGGGGRKPGKFWRNPAAKSGTQRD